MILPCGGFGVDVFGPASGLTGWTTHAYAFARAMNKLVPVSFRPTSKVVSGSCRYSDYMMFCRGYFNAPRPFGILIQGKPFLGQIASQWIVWETTVLPNSIMKQIETTKFIWTPSSWGLQNLVHNGIEPERVSVVPLGVDVDFYKPDVDKKRGKFRFLFVGKWENRKFVDGLIKAFADEFSTHENVELVLHAHNMYVSGFSQQVALQGLGVANKANIILSEKLAIKELRELYQSAHCFVMPTRAEGWCLPILESMACGVPAIVTRYSAPLDYVTEENGYFLNVKRMVDARCEVFDIKTGQWAEPDADHLRYLMRRVYENPEELREKGAAAAKDAQVHSWKNSAKSALHAIKQCLEHL